LIFLVDTPLIVKLAWDRVRHPSRSASMELRQALFPALTLTKKRAYDYVDIELEHDTLGLRPGSETLWRNLPQCAMTIAVLSAVLLICLGMLLGGQWTIQIQRSKLRQQAEERRWLNEEWAALRAARRQQSVCPRCGSALPVHTSYASRKAIWYRS
jgi:hypothetical protein